MLFAIYVFPFSEASLSKVYAVFVDFILTAQLTTIPLTAHYEA